jgi:uncharacterized protein (TIGR03067 family)
MELLCPQFVDAVPRLLRGPVPVVATVAVKGGGEGQAGRAGMACRGSWRRGCVAGNLTPQVDRLPCGRQPQAGSLPMKTLIGMFFALLLTLAACVRPGTPAAGPAPGKSDQAAVQGTWKMVFAASAGHALPPEGFAGHRLVMSGDKYTYFKEEDRINDHGSFRLDPGASPRAIDITEDQGPNKGVTSHGIYLLDSDTLVVCYSQPPGGRPAEFTSRPDPCSFLFIYRRVRP